jgi:hypothetical protein
MNGHETVSKARAMSKDRGCLGKVERLGELLSEHKFVVDGSALDEI